jgi:hypothetical protein
MRTPFALLLLGAIAMPSPADAQQRWLEEMQALASPYERAQQLAIESGNTRLDASCEIAEILSGEIRFDIVTVIKIPGKYPPKKGG